MKSWIEVSGQRLAANYDAASEVIQQACDASTALLAVIKANAYGHGAAQCSPVLARAGALWLGVTDAAEGACVRAALTHAGIEAAAQPQILVMCGGQPEDAPAVIEHRLTPVVWLASQIAELAQAAAVKRVCLPIHLEIDTGMSRQGVLIDGLRRVLSTVAATPALRLDGVLTHFASAEMAHSEQTASQRKLFEAALRIVLEEGFRPGWVHVGNTSTIDNGTDGGTLAWLRSLAEGVGARSMVREGLGLYGYSLPLGSLAASDGEEATRLRSKLQPVMSWKTRILSVSDVPAGTRVGYGGTFVASRPMRLALLPVGYADGLRRELSSSTGHKAGWVVINGLPAPIVGRISMNLTTVDITALPAAGIGDEVVLLGDGITAEDHAALAGTIPYEILCGLRAPVVLT